jgi:hypothetical protein
LELYILNQADWTNKVVLVEGNGAGASGVKNDKHIVGGDWRCAFRKIRLQGE